MLTKTEHASIQQNGANARAIGRSMLDNPYLRSNEMPAATGQSVESWQEKHDAWHLGWTVEDAIRDT